MRALHWAPRILGILLIVFVSLFAFDIFEQGYDFWQTIAALLAHLIPSFILILVLIIAWKKEMPGGAVYIVLGLILAAVDRDKIVYSLPILLPIFLIGILFLFSGGRKRKYDNTPSNAISNQDK